MSRRRARDQESSSLNIILEDELIAHTLAGERGANFKALERELGVKADLRGNQLFLRGESHLLELAQRVMVELYDLTRKGYPVFPPDVGYAVKILASSHKASLKEIFLDKVFISGKDRVVTPKSIAQKEYVEAIRGFDIVFGIGPAGTGKTFLAMAMAVAALNNKRVKRIILTRPAVEAGERLGFLPGDLKEKVDPYLRPLYDALHDMMDFDHSLELMGKGVIEVAPLAYMRGRTLNDSFVILDEAQNTTSEQMMMFLTRLGMTSMAVVTGDITQIDLPNGVSSGLVETSKILKGIEGIKFIYFTDKDVIRHRLVQDIIKAYERADRER